MLVATSRARAAVKRILEDAESGGYHLNPDEDWTLGLIEGLLVNEDRYGYRSCPCRLSSGDKDRDLDIVCPCDYRDADLHDYGTCYCALYVSAEVASGQQEVVPVPERRPGVLPARGAANPRAQGSLGLWRCRVCGYLCAREHAPGICPICKAKRERFEPFNLAQIIDRAVGSPRV